VTPDLQFIFSALDEEKLTFQGLCFIQSVMYSTWAHEETFVIQIKGMFGGGT